MNEKWLWSDFIYPHTWCIARDDNSFFGLDLGDEKLKVTKVPPSCYETITDLVKGMIFASYKNKIEFSFNPVVTCKN